jgi:hypothetical protein
MALTSTSVNMQGYLHKFIEIISEISIPFSFILHTTTSCSPFVHVGVPLPVTINLARRGCDVFQVLPYLNV